MNKLTKLLFSVFTSVAIATSAFAGEFAVTGSVKATYTVLSNTGTTGSHALGKGMGISNENTLIYIRLSILVLKRKQQNN